MSLQQWWEQQMGTPGRTMDEEFATRYAEFMEKGGFIQPCVNEGYEVMKKFIPQEKHDYDLCSHGNPRMLCKTCNSR